jgi:predicted nucleic acid-binding Zn ribbon protein
MTSPVLRKCPECGKDKLKRLIGTGAGIIFKGSGFFCTDYRSDSYRAGAKADNGSKPSTSTEKKTETKSEIKPAKASAKSDAKSSS